MKGRRLFKVKKRVCGIFFVIAALILLQFPVTEADAATSASDFKMKGSTLVKYRGKEKSVSVPNTVEVIGKSAFEGDTNIELVVLPNSVKRIDAYAFWGCDNLETVVLGKGLQEVGDYAFTNCTGLDRMTISDNIQSIGVQAFANCTNLKDVTIGPEVTSIHDTAFDGCYRLTIHCETGSVADEYAKTFYERQKEMPEYEDVPDYRPDDSDGENDSANADISGGTNADTTVDNGSSGNLLGSTQVVGNQAVVLMNSKSPTVLTGQLQEKRQMQAGTQDEASADTDTNILSGVGEPHKYTIVDGRVVADQAYYRNQSLTAAALQEGIAEIGQFAFARSSIEQLLIPNGVENICYGAFYHCDHLTEIELPETVHLVEPKAFAYSAWVEDFLQNGSEDYLLSGGVLVAYRGTSKAVEIPKGVRVIAGEAFLNHEEIRSVTFPDSLVSIGEGAFEGCGELTEVSFGKSSELKEIKDRGFAGCARLQAELPASVERTGLGAFDEKAKIKYAGSAIPEKTYEVSAQRLSNEDYRKPLMDSAESEDSNTPDVSVIGLQNASADLEGARGAYTLSIEDASGSDTAQYAAFRKAYERGFDTALPENTLVYDLKFYDDSEIPLTKLGKQKLTVTMPVPEEFKGKEIILYTTDRNGQLEKIAWEKVPAAQAEGEMIRFSVSQVAPVGICSL